VKAGKIRYVVRDFPLEAIHPLAFKAAEAAHCAGDQGKYWDMYERLFANQRALGAADLPGHAGSLGLDVAKFLQCLESGKHAARVRRNLADGEKAGVRGTPTFFLGVIEGSAGKVNVLRVIRGSQQFAGFKTAIDAALAEQK
jgi:protein-disulfide isomerase